ncbi:MAG: hypothetical protein ABI614_26735 [Planctomycetota bacterium]
MASISNMPRANDEQLVSVTSTEAKTRPARTELGRKLRELRNQILASGQPLLDADGVDREVRDRRGEQRAED